MLIQSSVLHGAQAASQLLPRVSCATLYHDSMPRLFSATLFRDSIPRICTARNIFFHTEAYSFSSSHWPVPSP